MAEVAWTTLVLRAPTAADVTGGFSGPGVDVHYWEPRGAGERRGQPVPLLATTCS